MHGQSLFVRRVVFIIQIALSFKPHGTFCIIFHRLNRTLAISDKRIKSGAPRPGSHSPNQPCSSLSFSTTCSRDMANLSSLIVFTAAFIGTNF
ncbi:hypothetical protein V5799_033446 [Amblyomma americanum]|uniref:Uncharacterized protein n=1 Tax=Amblyomma americanum TaxID=6943 RepID=A0AAQ4DNA6_AMBAM